MTKTKIEDDMRVRISRFLPDAIAKALTSYHKFIDGDFPDEAKEFSAHHNACKVAIAHIELLIKLARFADLPDSKVEDNNNQIILAAMMQEAEEELQAYKSQSD